MDLESRAVGGAVNHPDVLGAGSWLSQAGTHRPFFVSNWASCRTRPSLPPLLPAYAANMGILRLDGRGLVTLTVDGAFYASER